MRLNSCCLITKTKNWASGFCLKFAHFEPRVAYKSVAYEKKACRRPWCHVKKWSWKWWCNKRSSIKEISCFISGQYNIYKKYTYKNPLLYNFILYIFQMTSCAIAVQKFETKNIVVSLHTDVLQQSQGTNRSWDKEMVSFYFMPLKILQGYSNDKVCSCFYCKSLSENRPNWRWRAI